MAGEIKWSPVKLDRTQRFWLSSRFGRVLVDVTTDTHQSSPEVIIYGDYGPYHHQWVSIHPQNWVDFLVGLDREYFLMKITSGKHKVFDSDATLQACKQAVIDLRICGSLTKDEARDAWTSLLAWSPFYSIHELVECVREKVPALDDGEPWELARQSICPNLNTFYDELWRPFIEELHAEHASKTAAGLPK